MASGNQQDAILAINFHDDLIAYLEEKMVEGVNVSFIGEKFLQLNGAVPTKTYQELIFPEVLRIARDHGFKVTRGSNHNIRADYVRIDLVVRY